MAATPEPERFFGERHALYARFIRWVRYPQGLRAAMLASPLLGPDLRILEAGCGTGALTLAVHDAMAARQLTPAVFQAFDLTPAMLEHLRATLRRRAIHGIELARADVLALDALPTGWNGYDLVVSASMLEYVARDRFVDALGALRARLRPGGHLLLFITRRNPLTRVLIGRWWASNLHGATALGDALRDAGFPHVAFRGFPLAAAHLVPWGHVVEARN